MQIDLWAGDFQLERDHSAQSVTQRRRPLRDHSSVGYDDHVALQGITIFLEKFSKVLAADFLFAFNDKIDIDRQIAVLLDRFLNTENVRKDLAFVVGRAPRKNISVFQNRL